MLGVFTVDYQNHACIKLYINVSALAPFLLPSFQIMSFNYCISRKKWLVSSTNIIAVATTEADEARLVFS